MHCTRRACSQARRVAGSKIDISSATIPITTSISASENPRALRVRSDTIIHSGSFPSRQEVCQHHIRFFRQLHGVICHDERQWWRALLVSARHVRSTKRKVTLQKTQATSCPLSPRAPPGEGWGEGELKKAFLYLWKSLLTRPHRSPLPRG